MAVLPGFAQRYFTGTHMFLKVHHLRSQNQPKPHWGHILQGWLYILQTIASIIVIKGYCLGVYLYREIQCDSMTSGDLSILSDTTWLGDIRGCIYTERYNVTQWHQGIYLFGEIQCALVTSGDLSIRRDIMCLSDIKRYIYSGRYNVP